MIGRMRRGVREYGDSKREVGFHYPIFNIFKIQKRNDLERLIRMQECEKISKADDLLLTVLPPKQKQSICDDINKERMNSDVLGQTMFDCVFPIDCDLCIGCYKQKCSKSALITSILLTPNGRPFLLPPSIANIIIDQLNQIQQSNSYSYLSPKGFILINFKATSLSLHLTDYLRLKIASINSTLSNVLKLYGISSKMGQRGHKKIALKKIQAIAISLDTKKKVTAIVNKQIAIKATKKQQKSKIVQKTEMNFISEANLIPTSSPPESISTLPKLEKVYEYFTSIVQNENGQDINKSQKFDMIKNKYTLVVQKNEQEQQSLCYKKFQYILQNVDLVKKTVKNSLDAKMMAKANRKLKREINLIKSIKYGKQHFLKYYFPKESNKSRSSEAQQKTEFYMEYFPSNLAFAMTNSVFGVKELIHKFKQIVEGVEMLHQSGIVHRDLKPDNIMIVNKGNEQGPSVKIIDFSDSALMSQKYTTELCNNLGSSLPYSPFQCVYNCEFGVNHPAIDLWSLGMLLYEFIYKEIPCLNYQNTSMEEFLQGISGNKLSIEMPRLGRRKGFFGYLQEFSHRIIQNCLILLHHERMEIGLIKQIVELIINYMDDMEQIVASVYQE